MLKKCDKCIHIDLEYVQIDASGLRSKDMVNCVWKNFENALIFVQKKRGSLKFS